MSDKTIAKGLQQWQNANKPKIDNTNTWSHKLTAALHYAQNKNDTLLVLAVSAAEFERDGWVPYGDIKAENRAHNIGQNGNDGIHYQDRNTDDKDVDHIKDNLGHVWRRRNGTWFVCKHGTGWEKPKLGEKQEPDLWSSPITRPRASDFIDVELTDGSSINDIAYVQIDDWNSVKRWRVHY